MAVRLPTARSARRRPASLLRAALADIRCLHRRHGLRRTARHVVVAAIAWVQAVQDDLVILKELREAPAAGSPRVIADLDDASFGPFADFNQRRCNSRATRKARARRRRGCRCLILFHERDLVGHYWWVDHTAGKRHRHVMRYGIDLADGDVYGFDYFITPRYRGNGNATTFLQCIEQELRGLGYRRVWGYVEADNTPARWLFSISGYTVVNRVQRNGMLSRLVFRAKWAAIPARRKRRARWPAG
jgi:GNAT superfamily N-acetyltransferase